MIGAGARGRRDHGRPAAEGPAQDDDEQADQRDRHERAEHVGEGTPGRHTPMVPSVRVRARRGCGPASDGAARGPAEEQHGQHQADDAPEREHAARTCPAPSCPATSRAAADSGRKTLRMAWASHFSGKSEAKRCIHSGSWLKTKKTPDVNWSTSTMGVATADAPRPVFGTTEKAMPSRVQPMRPSTLAHTKVNHWRAVLGQLDAVEQHADDDEDRHLGDVGDEDRADLADEVRAPSASACPAGA